MNRLTAMRVIAWLLAATGVAFGLFTIVFGIVGPDQEIHAVHNAVVASLLLVLTAPPMSAPWSWAALVGGLAFIGVGEWEARAPRP